MSPTSLVDPLVLSVITTISPSTGLRSCSVSPPLLTTTNSLTSALQQLCEGKSTHTSLSLFTSTTSPISPFSTTLHPNLGVFPFGISNLTVSPFSIFCLTFPPVSSLPTRSSKSSTRWVSSSLVCSALPFVTGVFVGTISNSLRNNPTST